VAEEEKTMFLQLAADIALSKFVVPAMLFS